MSESPTNRPLIMWSVFSRFRLQLGGSYDHVIASMKWTISRGIPSDTRMPSSISKQHCPWDKPQEKLRIYCFFLTRAVAGGGVSAWA